MVQNYKYLLYIILPILFVFIFSNNSNQIKEEINFPETNETEDVFKAEVKENTQKVKTESLNISNKKYYQVTRVVDGDTIDVNIDGQIERIRMIGINTPETIDPRKTVECFGVEASNQTKTLLSGQSIRLELDSSQGNRDKYARLLRYVFLKDGTNLGLKMIREGYAYEYTYDSRYQYQDQYKDAQKQAENSKSGLWGEKCKGITEVKNPIIPTSQNNTNTATTDNNSCTIKGNINSKKEKIYHVFGCDSYEVTVIDESKSEKWFCSEEEALRLGWRKALNCD